MYLGPSGSSNRSLAERQVYLPGVLLAVAGEFEHRRSRATRVDISLGSLVPVVDVLKRVGLTLNINVPEVPDIILWFTNPEFLRSTSG